MSAVETALETVAKRKNIYVDDEALQLQWDFEAAGGNASELYKKALARWKEEKAQEDERRKMAEGEYGRIVVDYDDQGLNRRKAFTGRWLVEDMESSDPLVMGGTTWSVAETHKSSLVVVPGNTYGEKTGFEVFEHLSDFQDSDHLPEDIKSLALIELGEDYPEELDI